jgi:uncharacterized small protein (DUF1192 family)
MEGYQMVARLEEALKEADYQVEDVSTGRDTGFDLIAYGDHLGRRRSHYIQIKATRGGVGQPVIREFVGRSLNRKSGDEFWLVAPTFTTQAMHLGGEARNVRLFKFDELLRLLRRQRRRPPPPKPKVDRVVRAVSTNKQSLVLMAASVVTMIDEKIEQLKGQKPNDPDRVQEHENSLSDYEALKARVLALQAAVENFKATPAKTKEIKKAAGAFRAGVEDWWKQSHNTILSTSFGMTVFVLGTAICTQLGVPPAHGAYLSAALAGGSSVAGALKKMPKLLKSGD